ncbi:MAG: hypothetical protein COB54_03945 [Alphaproteobacteria bacterium]|nr:MAG: hypothetical protein COB54_03945 [Alphaproteobacteria bacterium]
MNDPDPPSPWGPRPEKRPGQHQDDRQQPKWAARHPNDGPKKNDKPRKPHRRQSRLPVFLVGVIGFLFILLIAAWLMPPAEVGGIAMGGLVYDGLLLAFVGAGLWAHVRSSPGVALRHLASWVIIFGVLALGYSLWTGGGRLGGELDTAAGVNEGDSISFRADISGHYFVRAEVNGVDIIFMVDTGATDVALTREDAREIGFHVDRLSYTMPYKTANGVAYGAQVRLSSIALGPISQRNIAGSVLPEGLEYSLLGMSFLNKLSGYKVAGGVLTLYP